VIGKVEIGEDATVGAATVIEGDVVVGAGAQIADVTALASGARVGAGEIWEGSPARLKAKAPAGDRPAWPAVSRSSKAAQVAAFVLAFAATPAIGMAAALPAFWLAGGFGRAPSPWTAAAEALPLAFAIVIATMGFVVLLRKAILPRVTEGRFPLHSWTYFRHWLFGFASAASGASLSTVTATQFMTVWYRLLGAKLGKGTEVSTEFGGRYALVEVGDNSFIADGATVGEEDVRDGWVSLKKVTIGSRAFVGNDAVVAAGGEIGDGALVGVKSRLPDGDRVAPGEVWFGSPAIKLPLRQTFDGGAARTFAPPTWKVAFRWAFESVSISLPTAMQIAFGAAQIAFFAPALAQGRYGEALARATLGSAATAIAEYGVVVALKWLMIGRYRPRQAPMWSWWALRTEAIASLYGAFAADVLLSHLTGTPFLPWVLRLLGVKVGKGVWLGAFDFTEFDCVTIGDFCELNQFSALQTHLYEDRLMKIGRIELGRGVSVGADATVLYDSKVGDFARLGPRTVLMKGEDIPAATAWAGSPAAPSEAPATPVPAPGSTPQRGG
ncbi:MAG: peptide synthetase, partial [Hyphomicrobiales bacterium]|nr:peptide synthetase [Hyphomicrobiales bacterium]